MMMVQNIVVRNMEEYIETLSIEDFPMIFVCYAIIAIVPDIITENVLTNVLRRQCD